MKHTINFQILSSRISNFKLGLLLLSNYQQTVLISDGKTFVFTHDILLPISEYALD